MLGALMLGALTLGALMLDGGNNDCLGGQHTVTSPIADGGMGGRVGGDGRGTGTAIPVLTLFPVPAPFKAHHGRLEAGHRLPLERVEVWELSRCGCQAGRPFPIPQQKP
eukprot:360190-Chlamydomonas_euryale.AAC.2